MNFYNAVVTSMLCVRTERYSLLFEINQHIEICAKLFCGKSGFKVCVYIDLPELKVLGGYLNQTKY